MHKCKNKAIILLLTKCFSFSFIYVSAFIYWLIYFDVIFFLLPRRVPSLNVQMKLCISNSNECISYHKGQTHHFSCFSPKCNVSRPAHNKRNKKLILLRSHYKSRPQSQNLFQRGQVCNWSPILALSQL